MFRPGIAIVAWGIVFAPAAGFAADPVKIGPEIVVAEEYARDSPRVASDAAGNFIVAWEDEDSTANARRWFATGAEFVPEFEVSTPTQYLGTFSSTSTGNLAVAGDAAGNFMVTFNAVDYAYDGEEEPICGNPCLFTRRSDANGTLGPQFLLQDPTTTYVYEFFYDDQVSNPEAANLGNGDFIVVWEGYDKYPILDDPGEFGSDESTFAAKTAATGQRKGSYFRVNTIAEAYQGQYGDFSADGDDSGNFVVAFRSEYDYDFPGGTLHAQRFDANGHKVGPEFGLSSEDVDGRLVDLAQTPDGTWMVTWRDDGDLSARIFNGDGTPVTDDFTVAVGGGYANYPAIASSDDSFVVVWEDDGSILGQRFDLAGNELSSEFAVSTDPISYAPDVAAAANGDFVAVWKNDDGEPRAQRFQVETPVEQEIGVFGKNIAIKNKVPDDPEKNKITWNAGGTNIVVPPRGTSSDPRCNGDPPGTVKATIEFSSPTSGHGSGVLPLPCENWFALGGTAVDQLETRSYRYIDGQLDDGPCSSVLIVGKKNIAVKCKGSGAATDLPYDLVPGTSEGTVHAVLDMGLYKYCSSFPPAGSADGSDGKKFKGKNAPIAPCP